MNIENSQLEILEGFLERTGMTVDALAEHSGVSRAAIYKFRGGQDIRLRTWNRLHLAMTKIEKSLPHQTCAGSPQEEAPAVTA